MITFIVSVSALIGAYLVYGRYLERLVETDPARPTPVQTMADGVDFVPLPAWRIFLIQLLNIAGLGPVFGPILGVLWGPAAFLWIVLGGIFIGAVHDYLSGYLSLRSRGASLPELIGAHLGSSARLAMIGLTLLLLMMVGVVFVTGPAKLLAQLGSGMSLGATTGLREPVATASVSVAVTPVGPASAATVPPSDGEVDVPARSSPVAATEGLVVAAGPASGESAVESGSTSLSASVAAEVPGGPTVPVSGVLPETTASSAASATGSTVGGAPVGASSSACAGTTSASAWYASTGFWSAVIFLYYVLATLLPIDQLIGRVYPFFGAALLAMMALVCFDIVAGRLVVPELTLANLHPEGLSLWPAMMLTIACGAISGFHATQSPMMARSMTSERYARGVFMGAMLTESLVALVWAAAAIALCGSTQALGARLGRGGDAVLIVHAVAQRFGALGNVLVVLGVVALPVTSGDTAYRSARLIVADLVGLSQRPLRNRLLVSLPMFALGLVMTGVKFDVLWSYFAWFNQSLSVFTLWALTAWLWRSGRSAVVTMAPAMFMNVVVLTYLFGHQDRGFGWSAPIATGLASIVTVVIGYLVWIRAGGERR